MLDFGNKAKIEIFIDLWSSSSRDYIFTTLTSVSVTSQKFNVASDGQNTLELFRLAEIPIFATLRTEDTAANIGDAYAKMLLRIDGVVVGILAQGPIAMGFGLHWPAGPHIPPLSYAGTPKVVTDSAPSAGVEVIIPNQDAKVWKIKSLSFELTTDDTVANRRVHLRYQDSAKIAMDIFADFVQTASLTRRYTFAPIGAIPTVNQDDDVLVSIPPGIIIPDGNSLRTATDNIQAGDQYSDVQILVEELINPLT